MCFSFFPSFPSTVELDKKAPDEDEEMTDLMELDSHEDGIASSSTGKASSSPSVGGNESNASPESHGAIETDTEDEEVVVASTSTKENGDDGLLVSSSASHPEADSPTAANNGFASQSEDDTEVADNDTASNIETASNQRCSIPSPSPSSSSSSSSHHQIECDPIDTLKG